MSSNAEWPYGDDGPGTRRSLVGKAARGDREAVDHLLTTYYQPLIRYICRRFRSFKITEERATELVHDFTIRRVYAKDLFAKANLEHGRRLRWFLVRCVQNFVWDAIRPKAVQPEDLHDSQVMAIQTPDGDGEEWEFAVEVLRQTILTVREDYKKRWDLWQILVARVLGPVFLGVRKVSFKELTRHFECRSTKKAELLGTTADRKWNRVLSLVIAPHVGYEKTRIQAEIADLAAMIVNVTPPDLAASLADIQRVIREDGACFWPDVPASSNVQAQRKT